MSQISENKVENLEKSSMKTERNLSETVNSRPIQNKIHWHYFIMLTTVHVFGFVGIFMFESLKFFMYVFMIDYIGSLGITAGAHRLWSHRSYKAKLPLRIFLMLLNTFMLQGNIYLWCTNHRIHHKYTDTNADPHNSKRGFFYSQIAWLVIKMHPDVKEKRKTIDVSDVLADPVVKFQLRYFTPLAIIIAIIAPCLIPYYIWDVSIFRCFCTCVCFRYALSLHAVGLVNSAAHMWGYRPYNPFIRPADNLYINILVGGGGFHNFHHTFPWDYSSSEYGWKWNMATMFIDLMAWMGLAYDRKVVSRELIEKCKNKYNYKN